MGLIKEVERKLFGKYLNWDEYNQLKSDIDGLCFKEECLSTFL